MEIGLCKIAGPGIEECPDGLFGKEVWMPADGPEAGGDKAAVEGCAALFILGGDFGGLVVKFFGLLVVCTLLIY